MTDVAALRELLERAVELEDKVEAKADVLEAKVAEELRAEVAELQDRLFALTTKTDDPVTAEAQAADAAEAPAGDVDLGDDLDDWIADSQAAEDDPDEADGVDFEVADDAPEAAIVPPDEEQPAAEGLVDGDGEKADDEDLEVKGDPEFEELLARRLALQLDDE